MLSGYKGQGWPSIIKVVDAKAANYCGVGGFAEGVSEGNKRTFKLRVQVQRTRRANRLLFSIIYFLYYCFISFLNYLFYMLFLFYVIRSSVHFNL